MEDICEREVYIVLCVLNVAQKKNLQRKRESSTMCPRRITLFGAKSLEF